MARLIYALSGEGRGHSSRAMAIASGLRRRGHEILFCCGGTARSVLEEHGENVVPVPALKHAMKDNRVQLLGTIKRNLHSVLTAFETIDRLCTTFSSYNPDLVITDFEAFSPRAAERLGVPVISFNHQQVITETRYDLAVTHWLDAALAWCVIQLIAPRHPVHILLTSFFFPPLKHPTYTTLVPPIIRSKVRALQPTTGEHILVYYNHGEGADDVLRSLVAVDASFVVYGFDESQHGGIHSNLHIKKPSIDGFLNDLASSRAVICTAGFTLMSEALYLGKPLLVVPNQGIFEQALNALFLEKDGLGEQVSQSGVTSQRIHQFLTHAGTYAARLNHLQACGNEQALTCVERVLYETTPNSYAVSSPQLVENTDR